MARISAPAVIFKSEWNSLATRETRLLQQALAERFRINAQCAWVNYVRSHDDIGWTFSDEDAGRLGINGHDHRKFLNDYYTGRFQGSFARGLPFQANPKTGDVRISGTTASLAGLEKAIKEGDKEEIELAIRRLLLIYGVIMTVGGITLIYLGDEVGTLNDYGYRKKTVKSADTRWVHRSDTDWEKVERRKVPGTIESQVYQGFQGLINLRKKSDMFSYGDMEAMDTGNDNIIGYVRLCDSRRALILAKFTEGEQVVPANVLRL